MLFYIDVYEFKRCYKWWLFDLCSGSNLKNAAVPLSIEYYQALEEDENLDRSTRQTSYRNRYGNYYASKENVEQLNEMRIKYTALEQQWKSINGHIQQRSNYIKQYMLDADGMMPALKSSLNSLARMVAALDAGLCNKVKDRLKNR